MTVTVEAPGDELEALRADNAHLRRTARQAGTALAHERALRERLTARLDAVDRYIATAKVSHRTRRELVALLHGHPAQT